MFLILLEIVPRCEIFILISQYFTRKLISIEQKFLITVVYYVLLIHCNLLYHKMKFYQDDNNNNNQTGSTQQTNITFDDYE